MPFLLWINSCLNLSWLTVSIDGCSFSSPFPVWLELLSSLFAVSIALPLRLWIKPYRRKLMEHTSYMIKLGLLKRIIRVNSNSKSACRNRLIPLSNSPRGTLLNSWHSYASFTMVINDHDNTFNAFGGSLLHTLLQNPFGLKVYCVSSKTESQVIWDSRCACSIWNTCKYHFSMYCAIYAHWRWHPSPCVSSSLPIFLCTFCVELTLVLPYHGWQSPLMVAHFPLLPLFYLSCYHLY